MMSLIVISPISGISVPAVIVKGISCTAIPCPVSKIPQGILHAEVLPSFRRN